MSRRDGTWFCPRCGRQNDANMRYCPVCQAEKPQRGSRAAGPSGKLWIYIIGGLMAVVIILLLVIVLSSKGDSKKNKNQPAPVATPTPQVIYVTPEPTPVQEPAQDTQEADEPVIDFNGVPSIDTLKVLGLEDSIQLPNTSSYLTYYRDCVTNSSPNVYSYTKSPGIVVDQLSYGTKVKLIAEQNGMSLVLYTTPNGKLTAGWVTSTRIDKY